MNAGLKNAVKPFSDNLIFFDTEFSSLDPYQGEILSIGLVKLNGEELYIELEYDGEVSEWVRIHVLHLLMDEKISRERAIERIKKFVGDTRPYAVSYVNQYDTIYFYKLLGGQENPFFWLPIDFASMLFAMGEDPESFSFTRGPEFLKKLGINQADYREHHALDDARMLRDVYMKLLVNNQ